MVKLKIEASVQNHYKNKTGREDWILFQRWRLGILKITFCPSMFTYFSAVKSRLTLNYLVHAWLEIEKCVSRGTWVIWHAKIFKNDYDQWFHYVDIITHVATKHECTARVSRPWGFFFCRQRKRRRVKGKTFFVAETQCQVIIYGKGGQLFPWQEQTFNSRGRARSTRSTPRCVTIATYMKETIYPIACEQALHRDIV